MSINYTVNRTKLTTEHHSIINRFHYSKKIPPNAGEIVYQSLDADEIFGAACLSKPVGIRCQGVYSKSGKQVLELRRLALIDNTPKNTESYFIGNILRDLKRTKLYDGVLSYSDPNHGHRGIIYRASNFKYIGTHSRK